MKSQHFIDHWVAYDGFQLMNCTPEEVRNILKTKVVFLLPYCLKPLDCEYRKKDFCDPNCKRKCVYKDLMVFLSSNGFRFYQITSYSHLERVINKIKDNFELFIGLTCNPLPYTPVLRGLKCANFLIQGNTCFKVSSDLSKIIPNKALFLKAKKGSFSKQATLDFDNFISNFYKLFEG